MMRPERLPVCRNRFARVDGNRLPRDMDFDKREVRQVARETPEVAVR